MRSSIQGLLQNQPGLQQALHKIGFLYAFLFFITFLTGCEPAIGPGPLTVSLNTQERLMVTPHKTLYAVGDAIDTALDLEVFRQKYDGSWSKLSPDAYTVNPRVFTATGTRLITVTGTDESGVPAGYLVRVGSVDSLAPLVQALPFKTAYVVNRDVFDPARDLAVYKTDAGGNLTRLTCTEGIPGFQAAVNGDSLDESVYSFPQAGMYTITITDNAGESAPISYTVAASEEATPQAASLMVVPVRTGYAVGDRLNEENDLAVYKNGANGLTRLSYTAVDASSGAEGFFLEVAPDGASFTSMNPASDTFSLAGAHRVKVRGSAASDAACEIIYAICVTGDQNVPDPEPEPEPESGFIVTFDSNGGTPQPPNQRIAEGGMATEPTGMSREGFTLEGWYRNAACTIRWNFDEDAITDNITIYARWVKE